ncbi:hypothetical protein ACIQOF_33155 [Streptomyces sp. NPDC091265]|uniref:hypothetical protein n=1 Tax=unclassified Streptomyces TaxID=2593676 RepID=UPI00344E9D8B
MTDPVSLGTTAAAKMVVSAASKKLLSNKGPRLGGKEERREVYARFQAVLVELSAFAQFLRLEKKFSGLLTTRTRTRQLLGMVHERQTELLLALHELKLVGNPAPIASGEEAMELGGGLMDATGRTTDEEFQNLLSTAIDAQHAFTEVCRNDLWYLPQWWQLNRGAWWKARWRQLRPGNG